MNKILLGKLKEAVIAVVPITLLVAVLNFAIEPMPPLNFVAFAVCAVFLILGMGLYSLGSDTAMSAIGSHIGTTLTKKRKLPAILLVGFIIGFIVTIAEPDLMVLAEQVGEAIPKTVLLVTIAAGVGLFLLLSFLRIFLKVGLNTLLIVFYGVLFIFSIFVDKNFIPLAFDSGGVTTGPITVPFIMALGVGLSANLGGKNSQDNSFGMIALCSVGPILMVMLLGIFYNPEIPPDAARPAELTTFNNVGDVFAAYFKALPHYFGEVGIALLPIVVFFFLFQAFTTRVSRVQLGRIIIGLLYTYVGLSIFLTSVNVGFMPAGAYIGKKIAALQANWLIIPVGMVTGACIVLAEPAVHVLNKQVEDITNGFIKRSTMLKVLSLSVCAAVGLSMVRVLTGISIWWVIIPGYLIALTLTFFVPKIFTGIAFDSGGVASGPMTTTFLLPFALGACAEIGGNAFTDAFGVVAFVAMTPLVTIQVLGVVYKVKLKKSVKLTEALKRQIEAEGDVIIDIDKYFDSKVKRRSPRTAKGGNK
ncbi:MAG: DUF1538 domain-containing protein [Corallococcus sp.]|nr:DUF1538 domain-containing protein [Corallococcus sp.]